MPQTSLSSPARRARGELKRVLRTAPEIAPRGVGVLAERLLLVGPGVHHADALALDLL